MKALFVFSILMTSLNSYAIETDCITATGLVGAYDGTMSALRAMEEANGKPVGAIECLKPLNVPNQLLRDRTKECLQDSGYLVSYMTGFEASASEIRRSLNDGPCSMQK